MKTYTTKPGFTVKAVQWTGDVTPIIELVGEHNVLIYEDRVQVHSSEVWVELRPKFWVSVGEQDNIITVHSNGSFLRFWVEADSCEL